MNMVKRIIRVLRSCIAWKEADCRKRLTRHSGEHQVNENTETHLGCRQAAGWDWDPHEVMDSWNLRIPINWHHKSQSGRSPGGGHSNPLQYSCLENPMDRGPGGLQSMGSQSWTRLRDFTFSLSFSFMDLTFQVPMQYCSLQHWTLLPYPSHPQLGAVFALALFLHSFWSYFSTLLQ